MIGGLAKRMNQINRQRPRQPAVKHRDGEPSLDP